MQKLTLAMIGAASLLAVPALAQTATTSSGTSSTGTTGQAAPAQQPMTMAQAEQKITHDLQGDGYTNVHVVPNSFLVHATDKRNEPVVMIINPDSVFAVTSLPSQADAGNPSGGQSHPQGLGGSPTKQ